MLLVLCYSSSVIARFRLLQDVRLRLLYRYERSEISMLWRGKSRRQSKSELYSRLGLYDGLPLEVAERGRPSLIMKSRSRSSAFTSVRSSTRSSSWTGGKLELWRSSCESSSLIPEKVLSSFSIWALGRVIPEDLRVQTGHFVPLRWSCFDVIEVAMSESE